jgi:hypothetical protein
MEFFEARAVSGRVWKCMAMSGDVWQVLVWKTLRQGSGMARLGDAGLGRVMYGMIRRGMEYLEARAWSCLAELCGTRQCVVKYGVEYLEVMAGQDMVRLGGVWTGMVGSGNARRGKAWLITS